MATDITVISADRGFSRMLEIELGRRFGRVSVKSSYEDDTSRLIILDLDTASLPPILPESVICFSRYEDRLPPPDKGRALLRPFRTSRLLALAELLLSTPEEERRERIFGIDYRIRSAIVEGIEIGLTDCEFRLFAALVEAGGRECSSEELMQKVWGDTERGRSLLPVYIHYLRKKLESGGRRLIVARRGGGYSIPDAADAII